MPKIIIDIKLDSVPGWGVNIEDFVKYLKSSACGIHHYIQDVEVVVEPTAPEPTLFRIEDLEYAAEQK